MLIVHCIIPIDHSYKSPMSNDFAFYSQFKYIFMALFQTTFRRLIALFSFPPSMSKDLLAAHPRLSLQKNIGIGTVSVFNLFISSPIIYSSLLILQDKYTKSCHIPSMWCGGGGRDQIHNTAVFSVTSS